MPPNFSGTSTPVRPSSPDFRRTETATPGSWCCIASMFGTISLFQNSSVVRAIACCSGVKSSGVNISSGAVLSIRKEPPLCFICGRVEVAIKTSFYSSCLIHILENAGGALSSADTHRDHAVFSVAATHFSKYGRGQFRASASQRMTQGDGAAVGIDCIEIQAGAADYSQGLHREGFIQFNDAD